MLQCVTIGEQVNFYRDTIKIVQTHLTEKCLTQTQCEVMWEVEVELVNIDIEISLLHNFLLVHVKVSIKRFASL